MLDHICLQLYCLLRYSFPTSLSDFPVIIELFHFAAGTITHGLRRAMSQPRATLLPPEARLPATLCPRNASRYPQTLPRRTAWISRTTLRNSLHRWTGRPWTLVSRMNSLVPMVTEGTQNLTARRMNLQRRMCLHCVSCELMVLQYNILKSSRVSV